MLFISSFSRFRKNLCKSHIISFLNADRIHPWNHLGLQLFLWEGLVMGFSSPQIENRLNFFLSFFFNVRKSCFPFFKRKDYFNLILMLKRVQLRHNVLCGVGVSNIHLYLSQILFP